jgi:pentatricopeptide repeat protein
MLEKIPSGNVVTWTTMILGHAQCRQGQKALELFLKMQQEGLQPDFVTFVGVLNACASILALEEGRYIHHEVIESGLELDVFVGNSLVDMYAKCGSMDDAWRVFRRCHFKGVQPNHITSNICLLSACSRASLVDEGMRFYASMVTDYMIPPKLEHYTCIVDLLGRAGHLQEAENMVMEMPWKPHVAPWMALLGACRIHGNVEMAERISKRILEMELDNAAGCVVLSNIYDAAGNRHLRENVELQRMARGVKRQPGPIWIEANNEVHTFVADNQDHPLIIEIHAELQNCQGLCMMQGMCLP